MQGARRGPYVDMVEEGNDAAGAPQRGAGAPLAGMRPRRRAQARGFNAARFGPLRGRTYACGAGTAPPSACPGRNPEGRGDPGAFLRRGPSKYRHIPSAPPPRTASHIAAVAHVPIYEIGSSQLRTRSASRPRRRGSTGIRCRNAPAPLPSAPRQAPRRR